MRPNLTLASFCPLTDFFYFPSYHLSSFSLGVLCQTAQRKTTGPLHLHIFPQSILGTFFLPSPIPVSPPLVTFFRHIQATRKVTGRILVLFCHLSNSFHELPTQRLITTPQLNSATQTFLICATTTSEQSKEPQTYIHPNHRLPSPQQTDPNQPTDNHSSKKVKSDQTAHIQYSFDSFTAVPH